MDAAARPLPSDDTTPPVTKMYFGATSSLSFIGRPPSAHPCTNIIDFGRAIADFPAPPPVPDIVEHAAHCGPSWHAKVDEVVAVQFAFRRASRHRLALEACAHTPVP